MTGSPPRRKPGAFAADDPSLVVAEDVVSLPHDAGGDRTAADLSSPAVPERTGRRGFRWGALLVGAAGALASLAFALSFARFVAIALERKDWIGWVAAGLLGLIALSGLVLVGREVVGFLRLRRLGRVRAEAEEALRTRDLAGERDAVRRITEPLAARPGMKWGLARLAEEAREARDPGDLLRLADRHVMQSLDGEARRHIAASARRVGTVSAISPTALLTVGWVLVENLRLLRALAGLYGGRPGFLATTRLARLVFLHIVATGGVALTDDLIGQFLGQDLLRRLSRRLGESAFNAALTARIGAAAVEVIRPLPFIEAPRIRARDFVADLLRRRPGEPEPGETAGKAPPQA